MKLNKHVQTGLATLLFLGSLFGVMALYSYINDQPCTLGVIGTSASVTLSGNGIYIPGQQWTPQQMCDSLLKMHPSLVYETRDTPGGNELCQGTYQGVTYTVRDSGLLDIIGATLCYGFEQ